MYQGQLDKNVQGSPKILACATLTEVVKFPAHPTIDQARVTPSVVVACNEDGVF
jgi:hypothetical protein